MILDLVFRYSDLETDFWKPSELDWSYLGQPSVDLSHLLLLLRIEHTLLCHVSISLWGQTWMFLDLVLRYSDLGTDFWKPSEFRWSYLGQTTVELPHLLLLIHIEHTLLCHVHG